MRDDWYGHRDPFTGEKTGDKDAWLDWDYALLDAVQTLEDWTNQHGLLVWEVDDPKKRVIVEAKRKTDQFEAAKDRITGKKNYEARPGEIFVPNLVLDSEDGEWPTMEEYIDHLIEEEKDE